MSMEGLKLRQGLGNWDKAKDAAQADGLESSLVIPDPFNESAQSGTIEFLAHKMRMQPRSVEAGVIAKLDEQIDRVMELSYGTIDETISNFFDQASSAPDPEELEKVILAIQKAVYTGTSMVASLYQDAYMADRVQQDEYWSAYKELDDKKATIGDRQAYAYDKSQDSRFYYYAFLLWRRVDEKLKVLRDLQKTLEWRSSRFQKGRYSG